MSRLIDDFLDVNSAAAELGMHPGTLARFAREGKVTHRKVGRKMLFTRDDLRAYLDSCVVTKAEPEPVRIQLKHLPEDQPSPPARRPRAEPRTQGRKRRPS